MWVYADGKKYWRLRYWLAGIEKSLSLGVYPDIGLAKARKASELHCNTLDLNLDPSAERKAEKLKSKQATSQAMADKWYGKQMHTWVKSQADEVKLCLEVNIYPRLVSFTNQIEAPMKLLRGSR